MEKVAPLTELQTDKPIILHNVSCPYCTEALDSNSTVDHVIGRSFVPRGKLTGQWNLILRACERCNREKAALEDDISAISMQPDAWGQYPVDDADLVAEAKRKGTGSRSRKTKKRVTSSSEKLNVKTRLGSASMEFGFTSPPQLDDERVMRLCLLHSLGFFYFITYDHRSRVGHIWPGKFLPVHWSIRGDWGNPIHVAFADAVLEWSTRVFGIAADGFFKVAIRKHPTAACWSWAYEWNHNVRIVGFLGEPDAARGIASSFPKLGGTVLRNGNEVFRFREEVALTPEKDRLFSIHDSSN